MSGTVIVWGAGAIGGTVGAHLVRAGREVIFVDRAVDHVAAVNASGLRVTGPIAEFTARARACRPQDLSGPFETVLLCVKAQDTAAATRELAPHLAASGYVVSLQNGLNELEIAPVIGEGRTVGAFVNFGADYLEPGVVNYAGRGVVVAGELDGRSTPRLAALHELLRDFEPGAITTANIWGFLWGKLAYGAMLFATALTNESIADALAGREHRELFADLAREVLRVAAAWGVRPEAFNGFDPSAFAPGASPAAAECSLDEMVAFNRRSAKTHSGIWRDLAIHRRPTEAQAQLGPIVRLGAEVSVPTPLTARLMALIHEIEAGARPLDSANLTALAEVPA